LRNGNKPSAEWRKVFGTGNGQDSADDRRGWRIQGGYAKCQHKLVGKFIRIAQGVVMRILNKIIPKKMNIILKKIIGKESGPYLIKSNGLLNAGKLSFHNGNFNIQGSQNVFIGNYCAFGRNITIITDNHDYNFTALQITFYKTFFNAQHPGIIKNPPNRERIKGPVIIGNDVWIGHDVTIMSGVTIGNGSCIGNKSLVTKSVAPYTIAGGVPARKIKTRFSDETIEYLNKLKWWEWDEEKIKKNRNFFMSNLNKINIERINEIIIET
jgi:acetyltransferase-like isoleucine patch superfamily enzyme